MLAVESYASFVEDSAADSSKVIPVPWQSGQSSQVNINLLAPPKKDVCPDPPQPMHGVVSLGGWDSGSVIFITLCSCYIVVVI